jgi:NADH:ubiquinone oxidoreductase subunit 3 (subunit A)
MNSSWDSYYVVFLSAILSLGIPATLAAISFVFFHKEKEKERKLFKVHGAKPNRTILGQRINVRFFLAANAALILIVLALELVPCATTLQSDNREGLLKGLISIVSLAGFAVLGLLYSVRKGDMGWLSSFQTETRPEISKAEKSE